jgi:hypothetical protein
MKWITDNIGAIKSTVLFIICWTSAIIFLIIACKHLDLNAPDQNHPVFYCMLTAGLLLLLLPFFKKVKFGDVELEREIENTKREVSDLRANMQQQFSMLTTSLSSISNLNSHVNLYLPGYQEIKKEAEIVEERLRTETSDNTADKVLLPHEDRMIELARTRIRLEYLLRGILQKRQAVKNADRDIRFLSLNQLTAEFLGQYPDFLYLSKSFDYVTRICNASLHAQVVDEKQAQEALKLGESLILALNKLYLN